MRGPLLLASVLVAIATACTQQEGEDALSGSSAFARQWHSPASTEADLRALVAAHPRTAALTSIGKSVEGREIWAIEIARDPTRHTPGKPSVLFNGTQHAREVMSTEVALDTAEYLLTNDGRDPKVTRWIDETEIWIVPMVNVDGSNRVWTDDDGWRKNARGCNGAAHCPTGTGVDINRNFPYQWAACNGSSSQPLQEDFHGPSAASEPETQALMKLVDRIRPVFDVSYHSFGEFVLYPYGCQDRYAEDRELLADLGHAFAALIPRDDGAGTYHAGTPWEEVYAVDGTDVDWMYHAYNVLAFVVELNGPQVGFGPDYDELRDPTVTKLRPAWQLLLDRLSGSGVRGTVTVNGAPGADARVGVTATGSGATPAVRERQVNPDGSFHLVVAPGSYHVVVTAAGRPPFATDITVAGARVDLTIAL